MTVGNGLIVMMLGIFAIAFGIAYLPPVLF